MRNIKLVIEYDGSNYSGWQSQKNNKKQDNIGIQEVIENTLENITGEKIDLIGAGRTDAKVHARAQVANFHTRSTIPGERFKYPLNAYLPEDIKIIESCEVDEKFHSRFSAKGKKYRYVIYNGQNPSPIYRNFSFHVDHDLDIEKMRRGLEVFKGTKDFKSFMGRKSVVHSTVRTIKEVGIEKKGDFIEIEIQGVSFLKHMIRIIVGTLVFVGMGKLTIEEVEEIIEAKDREAAGPTAPGQGLFLESVYY